MDPRLDDTIDQYAEKKYLDLFMQYPHLCLSCFKDKVDGEWDEYFCAKCEKEYYQGPLADMIPLTDSELEYFHYYQKHETVVKELMVRTGCNQHQCCHELMNHKDDLETSVIACNHYYKHNK